MSKDYLMDYKNYLQTLENVKKFGNKYGDVPTLRKLEQKLGIEPYKMKEKQTQKMHIYIPYKDM